MAYLVLLRPLNGSSIPRTDEDDFQALRILILTFSPPESMLIFCPITKEPNRMLDALSK